MFNFQRKKSNTTPEEIPFHSESQTLPLAQTPEDNLIAVMDKLSNPLDLKVINLQYPENSGFIVYLETLVDSSVIHDHILKPMANGLDLPIRQKLTAKEIIIRNDLNETIHDLLRGYVVLFLRENTQAISVGAQSERIRSLQEPDNEKVIRGNHDGLIENINVNIHLIRKRLESSQLIVKPFTVGDEVKSTLVLLYMKNIANPEMIDKASHRISTIHADLFKSSGYVEQLIEDSPFSPFPQILSTERPDRIAYNLIEGRATILTDGSPTALVFPVNLFTFFQSPDDYNSRWYVGSFYRLLRLLCFFIAITLPALYIAIIAFHFEVLPFKLVIAFKQSVELVPFPPLIEAMMMELTIELIREAGIRLPTSIGPVIGIVGGLIIGQAAVEANLVSNIMIIVVAFTATASFAITSNEMVNALRLLRFPIMIFAAGFGFLGVSICMSVVLMHLCALESFGTPYLAPLSTNRWVDFRDAILRFPLWLMERRPRDPRPNKVKRSTTMRGWISDEPDDY
ncbi:spore germination protein [Paenibacillus eucommiae]|uniref:Spore germination protein KA n=1 Tax=Paenibacillus eucommiae TaxID=1355755 RepID=A0ABS4JDY4_9BACL|nr:spore germination protein [Paenibacillus eucommiae]MBP1996929.1 spore germination protein KA [Paenibacillus eucommiae]